MPKKWKENIWVFLSLWFLASILGIYFTFDRFNFNSFLAILLSGIISISIMGIAQWTVLRVYTINIGWWIIATMIGLILAASARIIPLYDAIPLYTWFPYSIESINNNSLVYFIQGSLRGLMLSLPQWLVLRRIISNSWLWILATSIGWSVHWIMARMGYVWFDWSHRILSIGIPYALITGFVMFWLLNQPQKEVKLQENEGTPIP